MLSHLLQVALGGALGALARYLVGIGTLRVMGGGFPWGTITVNVAGSFLMGLLVVVMAEVWGNRFAPFLMTGLLGGFTTFSAFSLDAVALWERGDTALAATYIAVSVIMAVTALLAGMSVGRAAVG